MTMEIHFVTGKGGVGKSTIAVGLAVQKALSGKKTLLVELGDQSYFQSFYGLRDVSYEPMLLQKNLEIALWSGSACLKEYARYLLKIEALFKLFYENPVSQSLIQVAPALPELAILGKITSHPRHHGPPMETEVIVVDAFATGHFISLLRAPKGMAEAIRFGPMGEQSRDIEAVIQNENICHYHIVSLPEELPVQETIELYSDLKKEFKIKPRVYLNKVINSKFDLNKILELKKKIKSNNQFLDFLAIHLDRQQQAINKIQMQTGMPPEIIFYSQNLSPELLIKDITSDLDRICSQGVM